MGVILPQSEGLLCIIEWPSVTIAGTEDILHMPVVLKVLNVRNVIALLKLRTTDFFFFLFINLLHGAQLQSVADYLQQVVYCFRGLRG